MNKLQENTICSVSTGHGEGAIALIRVSGNKSLSICKKIFFSKKIITTKQIKPNLAYYGKIKDFDQIIDEVILTYFKAPKSYTGEDMVEISCHGSEYIQKKIIELLINKGCFLAKRGEFTLRAFLNGKLDLSQAESVANLISAKNSKSHELAMKQMRGGYSENIQLLRKKLIKFGALIELELDFSTEDVEFADRKDLINLLSEMITKIEPLIKSFKYGNAIKNGIPITIVGPPNSGKSTLLNKILNEERAIVSDIKGTTRDVIEETFNIEGFEYRFIDTAGLRKTNNEIEKIGIQKTHEKINEAAVIIYLFDINDFNKTQIIDNLNFIKTKDLEVVLVGNKTDLNKSEIKEFEGEIIYCSLLNNKGTDQILNSILHKTKKWKNLNHEFVITNQRHYEAFTNTLESIRLIKAGIQSKISGELLSIDIKSALNSLGEITGEITNEDLLDSIFKDFCIGK
ncbi:MAG: tRNA uridine-5-carboxymethylaminomethyl(34) synthesis GTPase MnmE [Bacteroidota bacterium]|nr:tRNA uridine-5-carboxymethylaminomethyl(34) synthesis GTPase MnmE [Bacteroidota bacterium]